MRKTDQDYYWDMIIVFDMLSRYSFNPLKGGGIFLIPLDFNEEILGKILFL